MNTKFSCPDPASILAGLKDFQRDTVEYVFRRLYLDADATNRFLIADEVGLGKTLVARGLIAKAIEHLWDKVERIDIVYICSNASIAQQNIKRLNITGAKDFNLASRITLLPIQLQNLNDNRINFVSFTPGTSFDLKSNLGIAEERVLLYWLLHQAWQTHGRTGPLNVMQGRTNTERFREQVRFFRQYRTVDKSLADAFCQRLNEQVVADQRAGRKDLQSRFQELCERFTRTRNYESIPREERNARNQIIGELRGVLAQSCISALEPDLIILDEFQRFKHLLGAETEVSQLAHDLFNYSDTVSSTKVVLLSATPYKMYTTSHEGSEENHYEDFLRTIEFLQADKSQTKTFEHLLRDYRQELLRLKQGQFNQLLELKSKLEYQLRRYMVRTERLTASPDRDGMLAEIPCRNTKLEPQDLETYLSLQAVARILEQQDTLEYWKSAPYLLNFMENYELKRAFNGVLEHRQQEADLAAVLASSSNLLLSRKDLEAYAELDPANARLRGLLADTIGIEAWKLLWIAPSLPYYKLGGVFADLSRSNFTKRLIFSSWRVVPKMIASLLSYEAERQMICSFEETPENTTEARKRRRPLLRFAQTADDKLTGMPLWALLYPSTVLARECDPLRVANGATTSGLLSSDDLLSHVQGKIDTLLQSLEFELTESGPEDESWYWAAPILLDRHFDLEVTQQWFATPNLAQIWAGEEHDEKDDEQSESRWSDHVNLAKITVDKPLLKLGKLPSDLCQVLAQLAIAGPGVIALRALARVTGGSVMYTNPNVRISAAQLAWSFRTLFNSQEATALIRGIKPKVAYWRGVLEYCVDGCLQSVLDEYAHVLWESMGLFDKPAEQVATAIIR